MDGDLCRQPGCNGTIEAGFCNRCGLEPVTAVTSPTPAKTDSASSAVSGRTGSTPSRRGSTKRTSSSRKHLGLGVVSVPEPPAIDPEKVILAEPKVPDSKRFCANPDCHDAQGNPTPLNRREAGWCPQCGKPYSFTPSLKAGDVVADQYEVKGPMAFGGLGWIYLAKDCVLNRWVVLKGLLNTSDESAAAAAVAERQFLAAVKHPNIVGIYNFVKRGTEGFIVMEYVNGVAVKELRKQRGPLPPAEAIAYVHRILGAFAYLHNQNMVYCDFKPDNFMLEGNPPDVKLIDMGGVRLIDDPKGDIYGTRGYSAPEAGEGPTVVSDLFTVGRTLAVLLMDFRYQSAYEFTLPTPAEQQVLARHDSLYRFLLRATAREPERRFQSADEMADQLAGVLREVVAETGAEPHPAESLLFGGDVMALADGELHAAEHANFELLPPLKLDSGDPAAAFLLTSATLPLRQRRGALLTGLTKFPESAEVPLRLAQNFLAQGEYKEADKLLAQVHERDPYDWRVEWYRAASFLRQGNAREAQLGFDRVYSELPGELAVKLALGLAAEAAGDNATALRLFDLVSRTDPSFVTASFGLARRLAAAGKRVEAAAAYARVPPTSSLYIQAQLAMARALCDRRAPPPSVENLQAAANAIEALTLEGMELARIRADLLENALELLRARTLTASTSVRLLGQPLEEVAVRRGLEDALRRMARLENDRETQIALVDRANAVRPITWI